MSDDLVARPRRTIEGDKAGAGAAEGETWRVTPLTRPGMGVMVDAWHELPIAPNEGPTARLDVVAEWSNSGEVRVFSCQVVDHDPRVELPPGWSAVATVTVSRYQSVIQYCHIGEP